MMEHESISMETPKTPSENRQEGFFELIRGIFYDLRVLVNKELIAGKLEFRGEIAKIVTASITLVIGIFILAMGAVFLTLMLAFLLADYADLPLWSSFGIVALVYGAVGAALLIAGKKKVAAANPVPQDTLRSTKEDVRHIGDKLAG